MIDRNGYRAEVVISFTNPTEDDIENTLFQYGSMIESVIKKYEQNSTEVAIIVFNYNKNNFCHEYSVFNDGTPFDIKKDK